MSFEYGFELVDWNLVESTAQKISQLESDDAGDDEIWDAFDEFHERNAAKIASSGSRDRDRQFGNHIYCVTAVEAYESIRMTLDSDIRREWDCFLATIIPYQFFHISMLKDPTDILDDTKWFEDYWLLSPKLVSKLHEIWSSIDAIWLAEQIHSGPLDISRNFSSSRKLAEYFASLGDLVVQAANLSKGIMISPPA